MSKPEPEVQSCVIIIDCYAGESTVADFPKPWASWKENWVNKSHPTNLTTYRQNLPVSNTVAQQKLTLLKPRQIFVDGVRQHKLGVV